MDPVALESPAPRRVTVVLACASADATPMVRVVRALVADGVRVELVAGIDSDVRPLEVALEQRRGPTLWVLCPGPGLDPRHRELLSLTIRAHEIAAANFVSRTFDRDEPEALIRVLRPRLRQLADETSTPGIDGEILAPPTFDGRAPALAAAAASRSAMRPDPRARTWRRVGLASLALAVVTFAGWRALPDDAAGESDGALVVGTPVLAPPPTTDRGPVVDPSSARDEAATVHAAPVDVEDALHRRQLRALDAWLVTAEPLAASSERAAEVCEELQLAGVARWRLPSAGQLADFGAAGFLDDEQRYWTADRRGRVRARTWTSRGLSKRGDGEVVAVCVTAAR